MKQGEWTQDVCEALWLDVKVSVRVHKVDPKSKLYFQIVIQKGLIVKYEAFWALHSGDAR